MSVVQAHNQILFTRIKLGQPSHCLCFHRQSTWHLFQTTRYFRHFLIWARYLFISNQLLLMSLSKAAFTNKNILVLHKWPHLHSIFLKIQLKINVCRKRHYWFLHYLRKQQWRTNKETKRSAAVLRPNKSSYFVKWHRQVSVDLTPQQAASKQLFVNILLRIGKRFGNHLKHTI